MLVKYFLHLKALGLPVTTKELLDLLKAISQGLSNFSLDDFYVLSRTILIKDEKYFDKYDMAFGQYFDGIEFTEDFLNQDIPQEWLKRMVDKHLSEEEKKQIKSLGGFEAIMKTFQERLKEQNERHQGGNKWIGTGGTSSFGAYGYNPEGIRMGQNESRHRRAVKVWDKREFKNLDEDRQLERRNLKVALKHLRTFTREGHADILDLDATIRNTANKAGLLDLTMVPEKRNNVKVLMFFDVGGSMDDFIELSQELFSQSKNTFKHLEYFYFHNCIYETVWQDNSRRYTEKTDTMNVMNRFDDDYKLIFIGDASMSPYELLYEHGSVEHMNQETGKLWLERMRGSFKKAVWLNPIPQEHWEYTQSIGIVNDVFEGKMFPLTLSGITGAMQYLS